VGEVLDAAVALYRARFGDLLRVTLLVVVPIAALNLVVALSALPDDYDSTFALTATFDPDDDSGVWGALAINFVLTAIATAFVTAVATRISADAYIRHPERAADALRTVTRRLPAILGLTLIVSVGTGIAYLMFFLPGVLLGAAWAVAVPVLILEGTKVTRSLGRSFQLTRRRFGLAIAVPLLAQLLVTALSMSLVVVLQLGFPVGDSVTAETIVQSVASTIASVLLTPFAATAVVALYFDLRIRAEAFDVQMAIAALDARPVAPPATTA
jgi:hypothetical protein